MKIGGNSVNIFMNLIQDYNQVSTGLHFVFHPTIVSH